MLVHELSGDMNHLKMRLEFNKIMESKIVHKHFFNHGYLAQFSTTSEL